MGDQTTWINKDEAGITAAFESALNSREALELNSGIAMNLYLFKNHGSDGCKGELYPITKYPPPIDKRGNRVSVWLRDAAQEKQMRDMVRELFTLDDKVLLKPFFAAYNSNVQKTVVCCMPVTDQFSNWIAKQKEVGVDGYLHHEAKNMIRSVLPFTKTLWEKGYVCDGLNDPRNYSMMDSHVRVLPFTIRRRQDSDNEMCHQLQFADLLENHLNTIWKDVDVEEFIKCLRDPALRLVDLLSHPLFMPPECRMALYVSLWRTNHSLEQLKKYRAVNSYGNWVSSVPPDDKAMQRILTYDRNNAQNTTIVYGNTMLDAHRFARDVCSHYLKEWRSAIPGNRRPTSTFDIVDKPLKKLFPGLLSKIYAFACHFGWAY